MMHLTHLNLKASFLQARYCEGEDENVITGNEIWNDFPNEFTFDINKRQIFFKYGNGNNWASFHQSCPRLDKERPQKQVSKDEQEREAAYDEENQLGSSELQK